MYDATNSNNEKVSLSYEHKTAACMRPKHVEMPHVIIVNLSYNDVVSDCRRTTAIDQTRLLRSGYWYVASPLH